MGNLTKAKIERLISDAQATDKVGRHAHGGGLYLRTRPSKSGGAGSWSFLYQLRGKRREVSLGSYPAVGLDKAQKEAARLTTVVADGDDPAEAKKRDKVKRRSVLLQDVADDAFEALKSELRGDGVNGNWFSPLRLHVLPHLGGTPIIEIDQNDIRRVFQINDFWHSKAPTAQKAMDRLGIVFKHAFDLGIDVSLETVKKARRLLRKQRHEPRNIPAMPYEQIPDLIERLDLDVMSNRALALLILTGARSGSVRLSTVDEFDFISSDAPLWTIPKEHMKGTVDGAKRFRIPLSRQAAHVVSEAIERAGEGGQLFPAAFHSPTRKRKGPVIMSDMTMIAWLRKSGFDPYRPHGFRSAFKKFQMIETDAGQRLEEMSMAHRIGDDTEAAYSRAEDLLEKRRVIMQKWADFVWPQEQTFTTPAPDEELADLIAQRDALQAKIDKLVGLGM